MNFQYNIDLAILVPTTDSVKTEFALSLANLQSALVRQGVISEIFTEKGSILPMQRSKLVEHAIVKQNRKDNHRHARQILWLDSDMIFDENIYQELNKHKQPIVAANYSHRNNNSNGVATVDSNVVDLYSGLCYATWTGMGCMLVDTQIYIDHPTLANFQMPYHSTIGHIGEDVDFCNKARAAGYNIAVDTNIKLGHVGYKEYRL